MRGVDRKQEFVEDSESVEVVGGGLKVLVDEMKQLEKEVFPLPYKFDERVGSLERAPGRLLHY